MIHCEEKGEGVAVVLSFGEVNTVRDLIHEQSSVLRRWELLPRLQKGEFTPNVESVRRLCDQFGAWLHIDAGEDGGVRDGRPKLLRIPLVQLSALSPAYFLSTGS